MEPKLRHQVTVEDRVFISLSLGEAGKAPAGAYFTLEAAKAFAWGILVDLEPHEAMRRGAPKEAFGFHCETDPRPRPCVDRCGLSRSYAAVILATPPLATSGGRTSGDIAEAVETFDRGTVISAMPRLQDMGLVTKVGGQRGMGGGYLWRRTAEGDDIASRLKGGEG